MTIAMESAVCRLCGGAMESADEACPNCRAIPQWQDYARAVDFSLHEAAAWQQSELIGTEQRDAFCARLRTAREEAATAVREGRPFPPDTGLASPSACWRCGKGVGRSYSYCNTCGAPLGETADALRYLGFLTRQVQLATAKDLSLAQSHATQADIQAHMAALRAQLESGRLSPQALNEARLSHLRQRKGSSLISPDQDSDPAEEPAAGRVSAVPPPLPSARPIATHPRRSILEIILDPRSIQWLLASGGGLLVVGLVIWLASLGMFKNTLVVAACMGAGTLALLGGGSAVVKFTRYQLAGRALTLLACLVMPLNLWFYQSHGLVTLDGHLWLAALGCCVLYAAAAATLKDPVFVYVLAAGVAMTGLLLLADLHKFAEVAAPSALLVVLGLIALHAERAFAEGDGPFSRKRFGMACFWSAHVLLGSGLLLLLGAQVVGWLPMVSSWIGGQSLIVTDPTQRMLAIALVLLGAYAYVYSDLVVRRIGIYLYVAAFMLLWAELLVIDQAHLTAHPAVLIGALALTSLLVNVLQAFGLARDAAGSLKLARPLPPLGILLAAAPVLMGVLLHLRATRLDVFAVWPYTVTWSYVAAMMLTAVCCRISAYLSERHTPCLAGAYLFATAAATLVAAAGLLSLVGAKTWPAQSPLLMLIPIAYLLASRLYEGKPSQRPLVIVAHTATAVLLASVLCSAFNIVPRVEPVLGVHVNLQLAAFCLEAAVFYTAAAILSGVGLPVYLATILFCGAVWQLLSYWSISSEFYSISFAAVGLAMLLAYRIGAWERIARPALVLAAFRCANTLISLSLVAAGLMALSRFAVDRTDWTLAVLLASFSLLGLIAAAVIRQPGIRRWYVTVAVFEAALTFFTLQKQAHLSGWQNMELFSVAVGVLMLSAGYSLWYREQDRHSDGASFCLLFGSLMAGVPLLVAAVINRFGFEISLVDEFALATVSILLFVSGFMFRLRAPTLIGGSLLALHLSMLLVSVGMRAQLAVGIYLSIGGAGIFAAGLFLSIYRDRLLLLPRKIREHEGVFKILAWR